MNGHGRPAAGAGSGGGRPPLKLAGVPHGRLVPERTVAAPRIVAKGGAWWFCRCTGGGPKCKGSAVVSAQGLRSGDARSCGCLLSEASAERARRGLRVRKRRLGLEAGGPGVRAPAAASTPSTG